MSEIVRVVVDAMGGDNAPEEIVKGAIAAVNNHEDIHLILTGLQDAVERELKKYTYPADRVEVVPVSQVIETAEPPVAAIRRQEGFFDRGWSDDGTPGTGGCICICRQHRRGARRRTGDRRKNQRN